MARSSGRRTGRPRRQPKPTVMVRCEGHSEVNWLEGLREELSSGWPGSAHDRPRLNVKLGDGGNAMKRLRAAEEEREESESAGDDPARWFLVEDTEAHDAARLQKTLQAMALDSKVNLVLSHLCIEVWFHHLLPDPKPGKANSADDCKAKLKREWSRQNVDGGSYTENDRRIFERTRDQLGRELKKPDARQPRPEELNDATEAFTEMPRLVKELYGLFKLPLPT